MPRVLDLAALSLADPNAGRPRPPTPPPRPKSPYRQAQPWMRTVEEQRRHDDGYETSESEYRRRRRRYPDYSDYPPKATMAAHKHYHATMDSAVIAVKKYGDTYTREQEKFDKTKMTTRERNHYIGTTGRLWPDQHALLLPLARSAANSSRSAKVSREKYLIEHPYGYSSKKEFYDHVGYIEGFEHDENRHNTALEKHDKWASGVHKNPKLDDWGRLEPAKGGHLASGRKMKLKHPGQTEGERNNRGLNNRQKKSPYYQTAFGDSSYEDDDIEVEDFFSSQHEPTYRDPYRVSKRSTHGSRPNSTYSGRAPSNRTRGSGRNPTYGGRAPSIRTHTRGSISKGEAPAPAYYGAAGGYGQDRDCYGGRAPSIRPPSRVSTHRESRRSRPTSVVYAAPQMGIRYPSVRKTRKPSISYRQPSSGHGGSSHWDDDLPPSAYGYRRPG